MKYYFKLQYWRLRRSLINLGINPYIGIGFYLISFIGFSALIFKKISFSGYVYPAIALFLIYTFGEKDRNLFLKSIFPPVVYRRLRIFENLMAAVPFGIFLFFKGYYLIALLTLILSSFLSLYNTAGRPGFQIPSPFSKYPYEFTVGFRATWLFILAVYALAFISIYYHNLNLGLFSLLCLYLICLNFYSHLDPIFYVWVHAQSAKIFLKNKIRVALLYSFFLSLIISIPLIFFNLAETGMILLTIFIGSLYMVTGVIATYVNFPIEKSVSQSFQLFSGILIPPVLLFVIPNFYSQAISRLKVYLKC